MAEARRKLLTKENFYDIIFISSLHEVHKIKERVVRKGKRSLLLRVSQLVETPAGEVVSSSLTSFNAQGQVQQQIIWGFLKE